MKAPLVILAAALPLAACISFGAKPPPSLLSLTATEKLPLGQEQSSATARGITIDVPVTSAALATPRVPVQATATSIAYVPNAQWAEPPARLFARVLADTMTARTGRVVLSDTQSFGQPGARLTGELRTFGLDATTREAVVTYEAALQRVGQTAIEKRRFEARVPVGAIDAQTAGVSLNGAANQVAAQVADWVGR